MLQLSRALTIPESATKAAGQVFKLAVGLNFIQGRRTKTVAAVCLYIACRRQNGNTVMLIDFADVLMVSNACSLCSRRRPLTSN
jgi:transcription factor IIIB subunit 2